MSTGSTERSWAWNAGVPAPTLSHDALDIIFDGFAQARPAESTETAEGHQHHMLRPPPGLPDTWSDLSSREGHPETVAPPLLSPPAHPGMDLRSVVS